MSGARPAFAGPKTMQTRFLYPFFFDRQRVPEAVQSLLEAQLTSRAGATPLWECAAPHDFYTDELLDHVTQFLFADYTAGSCAYLRISPPAINAWFAKAQLVLDQNAGLPIEVVNGPRFEMFLAAQGVGVLSLCLLPAKDILAPAEALSFNYQIAQLHRRPSARIRTPHPSEDSAQWGRTPEIHRERIAPAPAETAPLEERMGATGGVFTSKELVDALLRPIEPHGLRHVQPEFSVYTVARFGVDTDFGDAAVREDLAPFLSAIAQVEEPRHAGAPGRVTVPNSLLNRRHWAAVSLLGAAHFVSDQSPASGTEIAFDEQRVAVVRDKYFIPYLVAMLQQLALHRASDEARQIVVAPGGVGSGRVAPLRQHMLDFGVNGFFVRVSHRAALHRFYRLSQRSLDLPRTLVTLRRAIADIDMQVSVEQQLKIARDVASNLAATRDLQQRTAEHLGLVARVQVMVEWIEIFLVSVYAAHLWHMFASDVPALHDYVAPGVLALAGLAGVITAVVLRPWRHRISPH